MNPIHIILLSVGTMSLMSCGVTKSVTSLRQRMPNMPDMPEIKKGDIARFSFSDLLPSRVPIVEVREQDLRKMESGKERALAYQQRGGLLRSWFGSSADFREPELPAGALDNPEFGLLPPKPD